MKISEFLEQLPALVRLWQTNEMPNSAPMQEALGITRQAVWKRRENLDVAELPSLIEYVRALENQSKSSPEITLSSSYVLTDKGFEK